MKNDELTFEKALNDEFAALSGDCKDFPPELHDSIMEAVKADAAKSNRVAARRFGRLLAFSKAAAIIVVSLSVGFGASVLIQRYQDNSRDSGDFSGQNVDVSISENGDGIVASRQILPESRIVPPDTGESDAAVFEDTSEAVVGDATVAVAEDSTEAVAENTQVTVDDIPDSEGDETTNGIITADTTETMPTEDVSAAGMIEAEPIAAIERTVPAATSHPVDINGASESALNVSAEQIANDNEFASDIIRGDLSTEILNIMLYAITLVTSVILSVFAY